MASIERLGPDAWEVYRDLRLASLRDAPHAFGSRFELERERSETEWRGRLAARTQFVAMDGAEPIGTVGCRPEPGGELELVSMWVAPRARRSGVADRLVEAVLDEASSRGDATVVLWVSEGNAPAERLYARHGFARTGRTQPVDDADPGRGREFEMWRPVGSDAATS
jgi:ribosomal protein S18 acetylase RimI-like enzyme